MNLTFVKKEHKPDYIEDFCPSHNKEFLKIITKEKNKKLLLLGGTEEGEICWNLLKPAVITNLTKNGFLNYCKKSYKNKNIIKSTCSYGNWLSFCYVCKLGKYNHKNPKTPKFPNHVGLINI